MVDVNFNVNEVVVPATAAPGALVYTTGVDGGGNVILDDIPIIIDSTGNVTGLVKFNSVIDSGTNFLPQTVSATAATSILDLNLGQFILMNQSASTTITLTNIPPSGYVTIFCLVRVQNNSPSTYTMSFGPNHYKEGGLPLSLTAKANAVDQIFGIVTSAGEVFTRAVFPDYSAPATTFQVQQQGDLNFTRAIDMRGTPRVVGITPGALIAGASNGTLYGTSVVCDGIDTITSQTRLQGCLIKRIDVKADTLLSTSTVSIPASGPGFYYLPHDTDINDIDIVGADPSLSYSFKIRRKKDATATPRNITFNPAVWQYDMEPVLTQTASADDIICLSVSGGKKTVVITNAYGI